MSFNVQEGDPLVLRLLLPNADNSKFVRAILKDDNGAVIVGSPFTLANLGDGEYYYKDENNLTFPSDKLEIIAIYQIYDDNSFSIPTIDYAHQASDVFRLLDVSGSGGSPSDPDFSEIIESINNILSVVTPTDADIDVMLEEQASIDLLEQSEIKLDVINENPVEVQANGESDIDLQANNNENIEIDVQ